MSGAMVGYGPQKTKQPPHEWLAVPSQMKNHCHLH
jgi:hypothetical protein